MIETIEIERCIEHPINPRELVRLIVIGSNDLSNLTQFKLKVRSNIQVNPSEFVQFIVIRSYD